MSMTIGAATSIVNPHHEGGWARRYVRVGQDRTYADGSRGENPITFQWQWEIVWRVAGTAYSNLMSALVTVAGTEFSFVDHLGNSETCNLIGEPEDMLIGNVVHEVKATFREATA